MDAPRSAVRARRSRSSPACCSAWRPPSGHDARPGGIDEGGGPRIERRASGRRRLRDSLIVAEVALAFVLLVGVRAHDAQLLRAAQRRRRFRLDQRPDDAACRPRRAVSRSGPDESVSARSAYGRGGRARCARDGVQLRAADAGHVLRHADAGGQPAGRRVARTATAGSTRWSARPTSRRSASS